MQFEMECVLEGGRKVNVSLTAEVEPHCECYCDNKIHVHVFGYEIDSVEDSRTGLEVQMEDDIREEIELSANAEVYRRCRATERDAEEVA